MHTCTAAIDCDGAAVIQWSRDCAGGCEDVAAAFREIEKAARPAAESALAQYHELAERTPPADLDDFEKPMWYAHQRVAMEAAAQQVVVEDERATRALIRADEHEAPHTHPVFACADHAERLES